MNPSTPRRCANWFNTYREYILPRTDAPESFIFWSGIFTIASTLRRRVSIPKKYLGLWTCYPHMYLMFVGPPGMRKTTAIDHGARELLTQVPALHEGPDFFTKEVVLEEMQNSGDSSIFMSVDEFSSVFQKAGKDRAGIYEFLTAMYDSKQQINSRTKTSGNVFLEKPSVNFFSATTPGWITDNMPESVISGGFASRCIWVYEERLRINKMFFDDVQGEFKDLEKDLLTDLMRISNLEGEFSFSDECLAYIRDWEQQEPPFYLQKNDKLGGYLNRRKMHIAKLAMLHSAASKDELVITLEDWQWAIDTLETIEPNLEKIFKGVGKNPYTTEIDKIVAFVKMMNISTGEIVSMADVLVQFQHVAEPRILKDILEFAVSSKKLFAREVDGEYHFAIPELLEKMKTKLLGGV
jgi:DNA polymerase III delta prime subunit